MTITSAEMSNAKTSCIEVACCSNCERLRGPCSSNCPGVYARTTCTDEGLDEGWVDAFELAGKQIETEEGLVQTVICPHCREERS